MLTSAVEIGEWLHLCLRWNVGAASRYIADIVTPAKRPGLYFLLPLAIA